MIKLAHQYQKALRELDHNSSSALVQDELLALTDLTCLDPATSRQNMTDIAVQAYETKAASICVLPEHLAWIPAELTLKKTTVINFPHGNQPLNDLLKYIDQLMVKTPWHEIDFVFPYQSYLTGHESKALAFSYALAHHCQQHGLVTKVIIETGALPTLEIIYDLALQLVSQPIDFIKTSTGKIATGATLPAAFAILSALKTTQAPTGIKFSGGIRTPEQALSYLHLTGQCLPDRAIDASWVRFGASKVLRSDTAAT